ncbi:MAG: WhiB family transcriptional regulator [Pseudonocardia sp.]|nr:WhiB family transcriptional regulator [Pseudonocardia sp.]
MYPASRPGTAQHARDSAPARAVCGGCPVRAECLEYALRVGEDFGIWGGLDEAERRSLTAKPRPAADGSAAAHLEPGDGWAA